MDAEKKTHDDENDSRAPCTASARQNGRPLHMKPQRYTPQLVSNDDC
jgi:hypothetical protein